MEPLEVLVGLLIVGVGSLYYDYAGLLKAIAFLVWLAISIAILSVLLIF